METLNIQTLHAVFVVELLAVVLGHLLLLSLHQRLLVVVHVVVHVVLLELALVLAVKLVQQLHEHLVMVVEALGLDLLAPVLVVHLHVVEDRVHQHSDVGVLVTQQLKHNRHNLRLIQNNLPRGPKEQELEEGVEDLLDHLVVFLLRAEHVLQQLDQVRVGDHVSCDVVSAHCAAQHHALEHHVVLRIPRHQLRLQKVNDALLLHGEFPLVGGDVDHGAEQFNEHIGVFLALDRVVNVVGQVFLEGLD